LIIAATPLIAARSPLGFAACRSALPLSSSEATERTEGTQESVKSKIIVALATVICAICVICGFFE